MTTGVDLTLPRSRAATLGKLLFGLGIGALGVTIVLAPDVTEAPAFLAIAVFTLAAGAYATLTALRDLVTGSPSFRATHAGLWFGGGWVVPWPDVESVFAVDVNVRIGVASGTGRTVAVGFRRKRTVLRLPPPYWLASLFFPAGDARIVPPTEASSHVFAARLEALRTQAVGHEDGAVPGGEVPSARVVR